MITNPKKPKIRRKSSKTRVIQKGVANPKKPKIRATNSKIKVTKKVVPSKKKSKISPSALSLANLKPVFKKQSPKRVGRGRGSGMGKTATAGHKGQRSRSGHKIKAFFEGGQMPLYLRIPKKRGFKSINPQIYQVVNLFQIEKHGLVLVNNETLFAVNLIASLTKPVKILGEGECKKATTFQVAKYSAAAQKKIIAAQGKILPIAND